MCCILQYTQEEGSDANAAQRLKNYVTFVLSTPTARLSLFSILHMQRAQRPPSLVFSPSHSLNALCPLLHGKDKIYLPSRPFQLKGFSLPQRDYQLIITHSALCFNFEKKKYFTRELECKSHELFMQSICEFFKFFCLKNNVSIYIQGR